MQEISPTSPVSADVTLSPEDAKKAKNDLESKMIMKETPYSKWRKYTTYTFCCNIIMFNEKNKMQTVYSTCGKNTTMPYVLPIHNENKSRGTKIISPVTRHCDTVTTVSGGASDNFFRGFFEEEKKSSNVCKTKRVQTWFWSGPRPQSTPLISLLVFFFLAQSISQYGRWAIFTPPPKKKKFKFIFYQVNSSDKLIFISIF